MSITDLEDNDQITYACSKVFLESLAAIITEFASKISSGGTASQTVVSHPCYETAVYLLLGNLNIDNIYMFIYTIIYIYIIYNTYIICTIYICNIYSKYMTSNYMML